MQNPWDIDENIGPPDQTEDVTFLAVGRALTQWEHFEMELASIFEACVGNRTEPFSIPAKRAYGSILSFQGRSSMVQAAVEARLNVAAHIEDIKQENIESLSKEFREVLNLSRKYSARRNEIAHGYVREWIDKTDGPVGFALFPTAYSTNKYALTAPDEAGYLSHAAPWPDYIYASVQIKAYGNRFAELAKRTGDLASDFHLHIPLGHR